MRQINKEIVIFSVYREKSKHENLLNHTETMLELDSAGIKYTELVGYYKGSKELSLMIGLHNLDLAISIAKYFNQESILISKSDRSTYLMDLTHYYDSYEEEYIGTLKPTSEFVAKKQHSYSYNPETDSYFVVV